tara:strand:+ start:265 stop:609 length:345 start_codon:yes stop_codon:yes gene_type:complete
MRVRISYGMDISDVPSKTSELLCDTVHKLEEALSTLKRCRDGVEDCVGDFRHITSTLDKVRLNLSEVDHSIQDVDYILQGLNNYYNGEQNVSDGRPTMDTGGNATEKTEGTREG